MEQRTCGRSGYFASAWNTKGRPPLNGRLNPLPEVLMATPVTTAIIDDEHSTVCWGAVIAGGIAAAAVTLVLLAFGVGIGASIVSPWSDQGVSATTLHVGSGIFMVVDRKSTRLNSSHVSES